MMLRLLPFVAVGVFAASHSTWDLGNGFNLAWEQHTTRLAISQDDHVIWQTSQNGAFLSASAGNDSVEALNGNFKISKVDRSQCKGQNVTRIGHDPWTDSVTGHRLLVQGHLLDCGDTTAEYNVAFWVPSELPDRIAFHVNVNPTSESAEDAPTKVYLRFQSDAREDFYGLGAQASFASLKNQSVPIFSREQGVGRGDQPTTRVQNADSFFSGGNHFTTYTAIPQYISTLARAFYLDEKSTALTIFDFRTPDIVTVRYDYLSFDGQFFQAIDMLDAITMLTDYTGKMPELPRWVDDGAIVGIQGGQEKVRGIVEDGIQLDCPLAGVWLQDWVGTHIQTSSSGINVSRLWWNWEPDQQLYPTWSDFVQSLRDDYGVRTMSYINPFLANVTTKPTGFRRNLYDEASEAHYFVQNATTNDTAIISSGPGLDAGILDLTNPSTRSWFTKVLADQVWSVNISGFMADFGEYTPIAPETRLANITSDALFYHNEYPGDWAAFHRSVVEDLSLTSEAVLFHRSASFGSNRNMNLFWVGDQDVAWGVNDGIKSAVTIMGHIGLSGYAQSHAEIGGYTTTFVNETASGAIGRSPELLGRWGELAAVSSAVFRSHEGNIPSLNAQPYTDNATYTYFAHSARLFRSLAPYRRRVLDTEARTRGWPLLRMPVLYHPSDPIARNISYQSFYLGPDLYVAPVLDPGQTSVDVYLPAAKESAGSGGYELAKRGGGAEFKHVWTGEVYEGGQTVTVPAPYGQPAVFVVDGAESPELDVFLEFVEKEKDTVLDVSL